MESAYTYFHFQIRRPWIRRQVVHTFTHTVSYCQVSHRRWMIMRVPCIRPLHWAHPVILLSEMKSNCTKLCVRLYRHSQADTRQPSRVTPPIPRQGVYYVSWPINKHTPVQVSCRDHPWLWILFTTQDAMLVLDNEPSNRLLTIERHKSIVLRCTHTIEVGQSSGGRLSRQNTAYKQWRCSGFDDMVEQ
jgi:hypothetical protein